MILTKSLICLAISFTSGPSSAGELATSFRWKPIDTWIKNDLSFEIYMLRSKLEEPVNQVDNVVDDVAKRPDGAIYRAFRSDAKWVAPLRKQLLELARRAKSDNARETVSYFVLKYLPIYSVGDIDFAFAPGANEVEIQQGIDKLIDEGAKLPGACDVLLRYVEPEFSARTRQWCLIGMRAFPDQKWKCLPKLMIALDYPEKEHWVRYQAIKTIREFKLHTPEVVEKLENLAKRKDKNFYAAATLLEFEPKNPEAIKFFADELRVENSPLSACSELESIPHPIPELVEPLLKISREASRPIAVRRMEAQGTFVPNFFVSVIDDAEDAEKQSLQGAIICYTANARFEFYISKYDLPRVYDALAAVGKQDRRAAERYVEVLKLELPLKLAECRPKEDWYKEKWLKRFRESLVFALIDNVYCAEFKIDRSAIGNLLHKQNMEISAFRELTRKLWLILDELQTEQLLIDALWHEDHDLEHTVALVQSFAVHPQMTKKYAVWVRQAAWVAKFTDCDQNQVRRKQADEFWDED